MKFLNKMLSQMVIGFVKLYQKTVSLLFPSTCRFYPSCSEYTIQAIEKYGIMPGGFMGIKRLLRCHPFHPGGYDPLP
jgi:putative membrane protein insertion efficiency factor